MNEREKKDRKNDIFFEDITMDWFLEPVPDDLPDDRDFDPESWRQFAVEFDDEQIAWLKKHPEHDWSGQLEQLRAKGLLTEDEVRFIDSRPSYKDLNPDDDEDEE